MRETDEMLPRIETFSVGERPDGARPGEVGRLKHNKAVGAAGPLFGVVVNRGNAAFTFSVEESADDGAVDTYAATNIRVGGSDVANVALVPGGRVVFAIEGAVEAYLKLKAVGDAPNGYVTVVSWFGDLERWMAQ